MQLMRRREGWDPFREFDELSERMNRLFGLSRSQDGNEDLALTQWRPSCDISETEKEYCIRAELPDVDKNDVHVTLQNGVLTIQGERREEKEEKGAKFHRRELAYGSFMRRFTMPDDVDEGKVDATFKNGILQVVIGRSKGKSVKVKEIDVQ